MAWAKLHTDILGDPKLMRAARKGAKGLHLLPWLIAFAKQADDEGRLTVGGEPADAVDIAALIPGATPRMVADCLESLERIGVLEPSGGDGAVHLAAWERRSGTKPSDSKDAIRDRVTAHRDRKRNAEDETPSNALHPARSNATEKRREEENREDTPKPPAPNGAAIDPDRPPTEPLALVPPAAKRVARAMTDDEAAVLEHYKARHPKRRPHGDKKILAALRRALSTYSVAELCRAIDGNADDPWHQRERLHGLTYILANADRIDGFIAKKAAHDEYTAPIMANDPGLAYTLGVVVPA
jgi:hypothetical protein